MKAAIYYTIRTMSWRAHVIAVTSEKKGGTRWYGRDVRDNTVTHGTNSDIRGRFDTQAAAEAMLGKVAALAAEYEERRKQVADVQAKLGRAEREGMDALFKGDDPWAVPSVVHVDKRWIASHNSEWMCHGERGGSLAAALSKAALFMDEAAGGIVVVKGHRP